MISQKDEPWVAPTLAREGGKPSTNQPIFWALVVAVVIFLRRGEERKEKDTTKADGGLAQHASDGNKIATVEKLRLVAFQRHRSCANLIHSRNDSKILLVLFLCDLNLY